jgi:hypothetical protein
VTEYFGPAGAWVNAITLPPVPARPPAAADVPASARRAGHDLRLDTYSAIEEIGRLRALVNDYAVGMDADREREVDVLAQLVADNAVDVETFRPLLTALAANPAQVAQLSELDSFDHLSHLVLLQRRARGLAELAAHVTGRTGTPRTVLALLRQEWWVFGHQLVPMDSAILPGLPPQCLLLVRFDGGVHAVLVETPVVPDLVRVVDEVPVVSPMVHDAVAGARRLVRQLQDRGPELRTRPFRSDRAFVTVLIGHPDNLAGDAAPGLAVVRDEIRSLNSHLNGIAVTTYDELIEIARSFLPTTGPEPPA